MSKSKKIKLSIPEPCKQEWDKMTPHETGKFCGECSHIITDFSKFTDKELVDYISNAKNKICGKFNNQQLNRTLTAYQPTDTSIFRRILLGGAITAGITTVAHGQNTTLPQTTQQIPVTTNQQKPTDTSISPGDSVSYLNGQIIDSATHQSVPYAQVVLSHGDEQLSGAMSDSAGFFRLEIPNKYINKPLSILVQEQGYKDLEIKDIFYNKQAGNETVYKFRMVSIIDTTMTLGAIIVSPLPDYQPDLYNPDRATYKKGDTPYW